MDLEERGDAQANVERDADENGAPVVRLVGELDISTVDSVRAALDAIIETAPDRIVLDMRDLEFMDSSAIAVFLGVANRVPRVEMRHPNRTVSRILDVTGLTKVFYVDS